ncbi:hypothetical protein ACFSLT_15770 [Novosphingobium resinovorum]
MRVERGAQDFGIIIRRVDLHRLPAEIEHRRIRDPHAAFSHLRFRGFETGRKMIRFCYQPGNEHCEFP